MPASPSEESIRQAVRETYAAIATGSSSGCCGSTSCCPGDSSVPVFDSSRLGYSLIDLGSVPEGAEMGLGCGNPQAIASLQPGEAVLDLGSGGGFDCFLAARQVGEKGQVIGVDMTPEMLHKARKNAETGGYRNTEFRLGEIERLPVADSTIDVILSNCVINLSPDKLSVFHEALRVLKPGGRLAISDVVATAPIPEDVRADLALHAGCVAGAASIAEMEAMLAQAGFEQVRITPKDESREFLRDWAPGARIEEYLVSANIQAIKPLSATSTEGRK